MKLGVFLMCGLTVLRGSGGEAEELRPLLSAAATNRCTAYLSARGEILSLGTNALPALGRCAADAVLTWQERLVARICYERIARKEDIEYLLSYDWRADTGYDKRWEKNIVGPSFKLGTIVVPKCREVGLWYYYVELTWKETGELPACGKCLKPIHDYTDPHERHDEMQRRSRENVRSCIHEDSRVRGCWPRWCQEAVVSEPERYWCRLIVTERMLTTPYSAWHTGRYQTFMREQDVDAVPILVRFFDVYFQNEVVGTEAYPGSRAVTLRGMVSPIFDFADSRHADLLENFIAEKPALEPLMKRLPEVRARPAPPPPTEPLFRLGTKSVVITP